MRRIRLNLSALRAHHLRRTLRPGLRATDLLDSQEALTLTRRNLLSLAGAAAVTLPLQAAGPDARRFQFVDGRKRVAFRMGGQEKWVIDTRRFGGAPRLGVLRSDGLIRIELKHARYPGTEIPADMLCELKSGVMGWQMRLRLAFGGFESRVPFASWLAGDVPARSRVEIESTICRLGSSANLSGHGQAQAEFFPNWTLHLDGRGLAKLLGVGRGVSSDSLDISLLSPGDGSILSRPQPKRTLLAMSRGDRAWPLRPDFGGNKTWDLVASDSSFDLVHIEAGESSYGEPCHALLAEARSDTAGFSFHPGVNFTGSNGTSFELPLRNARYALAFDRGSDESAFVAEYDPEPAWLHAEGCSFEVGGAPNTQPFEVIGSRGAVQRVRCAPTLLRISAPLPGAIVESGSIQEGTRLAFAFGTAGPQQPIRPGEIRVNPQLSALLQSPSFSVAVTRPEDLLALKFDFFNLNLAAGGGPPRLVRAMPGQTAYIVVQFWPQHIAEESFNEPEQPEPLGREAEPPVKARLAGGSRLAFIVPDKTQEIAYSLDSLLDWAKFEQSVTPLATPPPKLTLVSSTMGGPTRAIEEPRVDAVQKSPEYYRAVQPGVTQPSSAIQPSKGQKKKKGKEALSVIQLQPSLAMQLAQLFQVKEPALYQTAIESPFRLFLSPSYYAGWAHALKPQERAGRTELWHTRLGVRSQEGQVDEHSDYYRTVRAVWATDYQPGCLSNVVETSPFLTSPTTKDRYEIVRLSSDVSITRADGSPYTPAPIQVNRLMLSVLGAWMNVHGAWDPPDVADSACPSGKFSFGVEDWRHIAGMGRDQYVRVVRRGYLFPFGHRAVKLTLTERKFNRTPVGNQMAAYLRQRVYVLVREHEKTYPAAGQPHPLGPKLPFQTVRITTLSTPALDRRVPILASDKQSRAEPQAFWPQVSGADFQFQMVGVDWEGATSEFTAPLVFVEADPARNRGVANELGRLYEDDPVEARRMRPLYGQKVAYARNKKPGDTTFETKTITFSSDSPDVNASVPTGQSYFYPAVKESEVRVATIEQLTGSAAVTRIEYHPTYLDTGLESEANKGQVFAKLLDSVPLKFGAAGASADKIGGLLTPSMDITGLSRSLGPIAGDLTRMAAGRFKPEDVFKHALDARLLGDISLKDVIAAVADFSGVLEKVPKFISTRLPNAVVTTFTWQPGLRDVPDPSSGNPSFFVVTGDRQQALTLSAKLTKQLDNKPPSYEITGSLKQFEIRLVPGVLDVLVIAFNELSFTSVNGKKPDFNADLDRIDFLGPLSFINALRDYIPTSGFRDPPHRDVTTEGIEMGYSLGLPPVGLGVFSLSNVSLAAQLNLSFAGKPISFQFDFCEEHHPFLLSVTLFGGGGYFGLAVSPHAITRMAGGMEFGGSFSLNLGVASGGVFLMAGLSYKHENGDTTLTGCLKCGGSLEVLAIITVSVEFDMALTYESAGNKVRGRATLTVEVEVLFFSTSVDLTVEREFAGGGSENAALLGSGAPYPLGPTPVGFADQMEAADWQAYCEAFA